MYDIEKAPASAGKALNEALTEIGGTLLSYPQTTTGQQKKQGSIAELLPHGAKNAIPTRELMDLAGCRTARQLQKLIEAERASGALILSATTGGYYLPADGDAGRAEIMRYERTLHMRAINTLRTLKTARRALARIDGQTEIGEGAE